MKYKVFIDGGEGTTGLKIHEYFRRREDILVLPIEEARRKDPEARLRRIREADISFLCLPDAAAAEIAAAAPEDCRIIDTSTIHRTDPAWVYGLPELDAVPKAGNIGGSTAGSMASSGHAACGSGGSIAKQRDRIRSSNRVANPGCHATGVIALIRPLLAAGVLDPGTHLTATSLTGYSGGGKKMIAAYEDPARKKGEEREAESGLLIPGAPGSTTDPRRSPALYALAQRHKHIPEILQMTGLRVKPAFLPVVADYYSGMEVIIALPPAALKLDAANGLETIKTLYRSYYAGEPMISVTDRNPESGFLYGNRLAGSNRLEIGVHGDGDNLVVTASYDNLGKEASGAAIQNMNIMLGIEETRGLL